MIKIIGISFCVMMCSIILKEYNKPFASILSIVGGLLVFFSVSAKIKELANKLIHLTDRLPLSGEYIIVMFKVLCIIIITKFVADICRDNGQNTIASFTEISAKILVLSMIFPLFETFIEIIIGLIK